MEEQNINAVRYVFTDPVGRTCVILGKPLESDDPDFVCFMSGAGRRYEIRRCLILQIEQTEQEFQLRKRPMTWEKEIKKGEF